MPIRWTRPVSYRTPGSPRGRDTRGADIRAAGARQGQEEPGGPHQRCTGKTFANRTNKASNA